MTSEGRETEHENVAPGRSTLRARALSKVYRTGEVEVHALQGVDLTLYAGELIVLLGASGSVARLASAAPPQFDGPGDRWSPESLLVAAVASCFVLTFRAIARASQLSWTQLQCEVEARLERVEGIMQFTHVVTRASITVPPGTPTERCERVLTKAEEGCLIANSLRSKRELQMNIVKAPSESRHYLRSST